MENIIIRRGKPEDSRDFANLAMFTAPDYFLAIFGNGAREMLENLFRYPRSIFSYQYSHFMEVDGKVAGMTLFYDHDEKNRGVTAFILRLLGYMKLRFFLCVGNLLKISRVFGQTRKGDMYSSNSAVYPEFRGRGLGERLFKLSEEAARARGLKRVVVDVKSDNTTALLLRQKIGYSIAEKLPAVEMDGKVFQYLKLVKNLT